MGYRPQRKVFVLDFGEKYQGLEVKVRAGTLGQLLGLQRLSGEDLTPDQLDDLFGAFAELLKEWNVEDDDGQPVPTSVDGLKSLPPDLANDIVSTAAAVLAGVPDPLPEGSADGKPSAVASLPTVPLSASPVS
jgi:hypothetical protein